MQFLPATLELVLVAGLMMIGIGLPLGVLSARHRGGWVDHTVRLATMLGVSAPAFVWAVALMLVFAYFIKLFPIAGRLSDSITVLNVTGFMLIDTLLVGNLHAFADAFWHLILPAFALAISGIGQAARLVRSNMVETYERPYIEMAEAYGFPGKRIAWRYAFRPSLIPSLTIIGLDFAAMLGSAFLVEAVYAWPGLSRYGVAVPIGVSIGLAAGYLGGRTGYLLMRLTDVFLSIPPLVLAMSIMGLLEPTLTNGMIAVTAMWWPWYTRLVYNIARSEKEEGYVLAAEVLGASKFHIMFREILPNSLPSVVTKMTLDVGFVILIASSLSFLGLGVQPPTPDLGSMVAEGANYLPDSWWLTVFPGLAILIAVFGFNLIGDALREILGVEG